MPFILMTTSISNLSPPHFPLKNYRETDPFGREAANKTVLGGLGGNYESMAYDNRAKFKPRFFITNGRYYHALEYVT